MYFPLCMCSQPHWLLLEEQASVIFLHCWVILCLSLKKFKEAGFNIISPSPLFVKWDIYVTQNMQTASLKCLTQKCLYYLKKKKFFLLLPYYLAVSITPLSKQLEGTMRNFLMLLWTNALWLTRWTSLCSHIVLYTEGSKCSKQSKTC